MKKKLKAQTQYGSCPLHNFLKYLSLKLRIKKNEGFLNYPYKDNLGNYTIGYGHLIKNNEKFFFKKSFKKSFFQNLFEHDFSLALKDYQKHFKRHSFAQNIQELIIEMIFQMGIKKVLRFKKMLKHIKKNNSFLVALEMKDSIWYKQTPLRVENLIENYLKQ